MEFLHTMVRVADLDRALAFYVDTFGLKEVRRVDNEKGRFTLVFLAAPGDVGRAAATTGIRRPIPAGATSGTSPIRWTTSTPSAPS